jgi:hypothetical protein
MAFFDDPDVKAWLESAGRDMLPQMEASAISFAIFTGKIDPKLCIEIGAAVLYDKPIVLLVVRDSFVPANLERCAAQIVRGEMNDPETRRRMQQAIEQVLAERKPQ